MSRTLGLNTKVTIGVCVKNSEKVIRGCLKSIVNQNYPKKLMEMIIVDGQSKDKTLEIARQLILDSDIVSRFYSDDGAGLGAARQIVLENTNDRYIVWIDADALILEDFVKRQVEFMEENCKVCVATGKYIYTRNAYTSLHASLEGISKYLVSAISASAQIDRGIPPNDTSIYRVEAMKQVGGFDTNIRGAGEDLDIITKMRKRGWLVAINEHARYYVLPRATWQDAWVEMTWFGYGGHFLGHKDKSLHVCMCNIPLVRFFDGFRVGSKAYRLTAEKKSYLIPLDKVFMTAGWWYGYIKAHFEGYGH